MIIVFEGLDGCGKGTQCSKLAKHLEKENIPLTCVDFPCYGNPSCGCVEQYLSGLYGDSPDSVNPYAVSAFYDVDRVAAFLHDNKWNEKDGIVLCNRYTTSNYIYQAARVPQVERRDFWKWLYDFEYRKLGLPEPDLVFYLDMPVEQSVELVKRRGRQTDILERDIEYQRECYNTAQVAIQAFGWKSISSMENGELRSENEIHKDIWDIASKFIEEWCEKYG